MAGGLMQLVAYGAQDIYLSGNPQITFFKVVYRRHTNFSMESIEQTFSGTADFGKKVTATISRNGDLVHRMYVVVTLPAVVGVASGEFRWLNWVGHVLVKNYEVQIGGQRIDKHYGDWLHIWNELTQTAGHQAGYANMVGNVPRLTQAIIGAGAETPAVELFIPLQFWFCRNPGLALPLIALQYHEVKVEVEFRNKSECYWSLGVAADVGALTSSLWVDYVYLDTDERRRFAQVSHEYLIEQLQFTGDESTSVAANKIKLNFNHPCKELIWVTQKDSVIDATVVGSMGGNQWFNYTDALDQSYSSGTPSDPLGGGMGTASFHVGNFPYSLPYTGTVASAGAAATNTGSAVSLNSTSLTFYDLLGPDVHTSNGATVDEFNGASRGWSAGLPVLDAGQNPTLNAKLQLNGHDRFSQRNGRYFNLVQPYQHHTNVPATGINCYSFALKPEDHQPSGTCNFSRIDNATLQLTHTGATGASKVRVYAVNYNVLRIMSGMGGLAYSN
jgi:hypothetical protein